MSDNKPSRSGSIRKGTMKQDEIKNLAQDLTKGQLTTTGGAIKTYKKIKNAQITLCDKDGKSKETRAVTLVEAPKVEPVKKGDYKTLSKIIKDKLKNEETTLVSSILLKTMFPQVKCAGDVAKNLKRYYGLSYRRDGNKYIFFVEPTREELIVQLTSAESKVIDLRSTNKELYKECNDLINLYKTEIEDLKEENEQLEKEAKRISILIDFNLVLTLIWLGLTLYTNHR